jgi:hypothetical protein
MRNIVLAIILLFLFAGISSAAEVGIDYDSRMVYNVTVKKVEAYNSTTGQWVTVTDTPTTFNIASATSTNAAIGNMASGVTLPNGIYTQGRVTVSNQFGIKACDNSGTKCTDGTQPIGTHTLATTNAGSYAAASTVNTVIDFSAVPGIPACPATPQCYSGSDLVMTGNVSFTVGAGSAPKTISVSFDVDGVLKYNNAVPFYISPGQPGVDIEIE